MRGRGGPKDNRAGASRGNKPPSQHPRQPQNPRQPQQPPKQPQSNPAPNKDSKPKDYSTAILDRKKAPHRLIVEDGLGPSEDSSVIQLTQKKNGRIKNF